MRRDGGWKGWPLNPEGLDWVTGLLAASHVPVRKEQHRLRFFRFRLLDLAIFGGRWYGRQVYRAHKSIGPLVAPTVGA